jgi:hypothetical protein
MRNHRTSLHDGHVSVANLSSSIPTTTRVGISSRSIRRSLYLSGVDPISGAAGERGIGVRPQIPRATTEQADSRDAA